MLCLSVSIASDARVVKTEIDEIKSQLPESCRLVIGGDGAPKDSDLNRVTDFYEFYDWLCGEKIMGEPL